MLKIRLSRLERSKARECVCLNVDRLFAKLEKEGRSDAWRGSNLKRCIHYFRSARGPMNKRLAFDSFRFLVNGMFGRKEHSGFVGYPPQAPIWFRNLMNALKIDENLILVPFDEIKEIEEKEEKGHILKRLAGEPWLLGQTGPRTKHDVTYRDAAREQLKESIKRLKELGMTSGEIRRFIAKNRPVARTKMREYLIKELNDMKEGLQLEMSATSKAIREGRGTCSFKALNREAQYARERCEALKHQHKALGMNPPRTSWADMYVMRLKMLHRASRRMRRRMNAAERREAKQRSGGGYEHGILGAVH